MVSEHSAHDILTSSEPVFEEPEIGSTPAIQQELMPDLAARVLHAVYYRVKQDYPRPVGLDPLREMVRTAAGNCSTQRANKLLKEATSTLVAKGDIFRVMPHMGFVALLPDNGDLLSQRATAEPTYAVLPKRTRVGRRAALNSVAEPLSTTEKNRRTFVGTKVGQILVEANGWPISEETIVAQIPRFSNKKPDVYIREALDSMLNDGTIFMHVEKGVPYYIAAEQTESARVLDDRTWRHIVIQLAQGLILESPGGILFPNLLSRINLQLDRKAKAEDLMWTLNIIKKVEEKRGFQLNKTAAETTLTKRPTISLSLVPARKDKCP